MRLWNLVIKEISRRKLNFALGLISIVLAVAVFAGSLTLLEAHDLRTEQIIAQKERETRERMAVLEDDYRKIMKNLGFNLLILPREQNLSDLYLDDYAAHTMPEEYVTRLSESRIMSIRHLLPSLQRKIKWPEQRRTIILIGTRGEVPLLHRDPKEPILVAVPRGSAVVGFEIASSIGLEAGDEIQILGRKFIVEKCNGERGSKDDITIWIDLQQAQEMLDEPDKINAILALKCHCIGNEIAQVRREVNAVLPGVQVIEQGTKVLTRAEARDRAAVEARQAIEAEIRNRAELRREGENLASVLVPSISLAAGIWIALLFFANARQRRSEIGILRAIGVKSSGVLYLFLAKALVMGIAGAVIGFVLALTVTFLWQKVPQPASLLDPRLFALALLFAPLLSLLASWIPVFLASQQDPALVMKEE